MNESLKVARSAVRCPYCHGAIAVAEHDWNVCRSCLARHHIACWSESRVCAACGGHEALAEAPGPAAPAPVIIDVAAPARARELARLRVEAELSRADREWANELAARCRVERGQLIEPTRWDALTGALVAVLGVALAVVTMIFGEPLGVPAGLTLSALGAVHFTAAAGHALGFRRAHARHIARRRALLAEGDRLREEPL